MWLCLQVFAWPISGVWGAVYICTPSHSATQSLHLWYHLSRTTYIFFALMMWSFLSRSKYDSHLLASADQLVCYDLDPKLWLQPFRSTIDGASCCHVRQQKLGEPKSMLLSPARLHRDVRVVWIQKRGMVLSLYITTRILNTNDDTNAKFQATFAVNIFLLLTKLSLTIGPALDTPSCALPLDACLGMRGPVAQDFTNDNDQSGFPSPTKSEPRIATKAIFEYI